MLKCIGLIIFSSLLLSNAYASECVFVSDERFCADEKIKILDNSLSDTPMSKERKETIKYMITTLCANDIGCAHNTLSYQYTNKGNTAKKYAVILKNQFNQCITVQTAYPEYSKVLLINEKGSKFEASFNENLYTTSDRQLYVLDSTPPMLKTNCSGVSKQAQLIKMN